MRSPGFTTRGQSGRFIVKKGAAYFSYFLLRQMCEHTVYRAVCGEVKRHKSLLNRRQFLPPSSSFETIFVGDIQKTGALAIFI